MDEKVVEQIRERLNSRGSEELLRIWQENDRNEWSDEAFEAVKQILIGRGKRLPPQGQVVAAAPGREAIEEKVKPKLGGWLILISIGLVLSPVLYIVHIVEVTNILEGSEYQSVLNSYEGFEAFLQFQIFTDTGLLVFTIVVASHFFRKHATTPKSIIALLVAALVLSLLDYMFFLSIFGPENPANAEAVLGTVRAILATAIWIPYFVKSKRVKETFIN